MLRVYERKVSSNPGQLVMSAMFSMLRSARMTTACSALVLLLTAACSTPQITYPPGTTEPLFTNLGGYRRATSTDSPLAQRYFDQGCVMRYQLANEAARRAFVQATELDPECAMAWWGVAWSRGPNFWSSEVSEEDAAVAWRAVRRAQVAVAKRGTDMERQLVTAMATWFSDNPKGDRTPLNKAYADAMVALWEQHHDDAEIGTIYALSLVALNPERLWTYDAYKHPVTQRIVQVLERVLELDPAHPGANHYLIHAVEASPDFMRAQPAADRLRTLAPGASHLLHMASHIDVLAGDWDKAIAANERANAVTHQLLDAGLDALVYSPAWTHDIT